MVIHDTLKLEHKLQLLTEGIYPLLWYPSKELKKNTNNQFNSLVWFIIHSLDEKQKLNGYQLKNVERILTLCRSTHNNWNKKIVFEKIEEADIKKFEQVQNDWWQATMFDQ